MHLLLTGEVQVGKSTIIKKLLEKIHGSIGGFRTVLGPTTADGSSDVFMIGAVAQMEDCREETRVAKRLGRGRFQSFPDVFDRVGAELLQAAQAKDWIVMDELGFMERDAQIFQRAVLDCFDGNTPVLGVVKPAYTPFLEKIHAHKNVHIIQVTKENRDEALKQAFGLLMCPPMHSSDG